MDRAVFEGSDSDPAVIATQAAGSAIAKRRAAAEEAARAWAQQRQQQQPQQQRNWELYCKRHKLDRNFDDFRADQLLRWLTNAALGDRCRHCVDEPRAASCPSCSSALDPDPVTSNTLATRAGSRLYGQKHSEAVRVFQRRCASPSCQYAQAYDGKQAGVVNYSNVSLFCEELPRDFYHNFFVQKSQTLTSYWKRVCQGYENVHSGEDQFVSRKLFS